MNAIINTKLIMEDGIIWNGALTYEDGKILEVGPAEAVTIPEGAEILDAGGLYTAPGLIDLHNHGGGGKDFHQDPMSSVRHFLAHGETSILPTLYFTLTAEEMLSAAQRIRELSKEGIGRVMLGLYMEGPYMATMGSNQKYIKWQGDIPTEEFAHLVDTIGDMVRIWAICPARENIERFMGYVKERYPDAIFALGHSRATAAQCKKVAKYGVKVQTHHGDSGKAEGRAQGTIGAGCDEYTLYNPDMYAELICDQTGVHVVPEMVRMVVRTKGVEKICLITDSMSPAGDFTNNEADGIWYGPDLNYDYEGHLAGSHLTLDNACRNLMTHTGYGLCHAIRMATLNPAKLLGVDDTLGSLEPGKTANLILIDDMIHVRSVILEGRHVAQDGVLLC